MLAAFEDPALEQRTLDYAVSGKVRNQDALSLVATALYREETRPLAWQFLQSHWEQVKPLLTPEMGGILVNSNGGVCTAAERDDIKAFFSAHPIPAADKTLAKALERIDGCIEFRSLQEPNLKTWLATHAQ